MSSRSPSVSTPLPLRVASGRVVKKYLAFSAELDRGYCLQAQLQSAAFRSSYVLGSTWLNVYQISCALVATADVRHRGTDYWAGPDWYSARAHRCGAGRALISGLR